MRGASWLVRRRTSTSRWFDNYFSQGVVTYGTTRTGRRWILSDAVEKRVTASLERHESILQEMNSAGHTSASLGKELSSLSSLVSLCKERIKLQEEETALEEMLQDLSSSQDGNDDDEMKQECVKEIDLVTNQITEIERNILDAVIPQDEDDCDSDAIIEVRAGTGGDEASLFAFELLEAYTKAAKALKWKVDALDQSKTDIGGLKEGAIVVSGGSTFDPNHIVSDSDGSSTSSSSSSALLGPYGAFKFESGVHRVQRVPVNDSRIHTSACSVAVLPSIPESGTNKALPMSELKIETMRASGAGGQHVNTTDSAVRITHLPTGVTASIQDERSQHKNKEKALRLITARVRDAERAAADKARGETRTSLMGGGDRSERIRTYNFPQDRITDHRCKETRHGIESLLNVGANSEADNLVVTFFPHLRSMEREELLAQLEAEEDATTTK